MGTIHSRPEGDETEKGSVKKKLVAGMMRAKAAGKRIDEYCARVGGLANGDYQDRFE